MKSSRKYFKALVNLGVAVAVLLLVVILLPRLLVFFMPFVVAGIISMIASPLVRFFEEKIKLKRKWGSAFVIIVVIALVVLVLYLVGSKLIEEGMGLLGALPEMWDSMKEDLAGVGESLDGLFEKLPLDTQQAIANLGNQVGEFMAGLFERIGTPTITAAGNFAKQLPSVLIGIIMCLLASYFFVADRYLIGSWIRKYTPASIMSRYDMVRRSILKSVGGYFKAQLKIEVWMYLLLVVGLSVLRVDYVLLIALGIAFLDLLPFFGTGTVMVPWALIKIFSGDYKMAIGLLIIWGGGQLARQIIQPKIVGDSIGVAPIPTLFLLFIGYKLGGVIGMIIAVPLGMLLSTMYQEGVFDTTRNSIAILVSGLNHFRKLRPEDLEVVEEMRDKKTSKNTQ
ncbi:sodium-lithium/proton antiporter [Lachnospiraceae bacterium]|jgi:sporulation integral membrane protein YtvI|nr:sporulation integral membrane protein YtvI [Lachnospiraceae bacterium]MCX4273923.1 sporulation integral membrane protein YtvI [Acetatifactor sp.]GFH95159.1 sodium-lithium/proton antiporter [Lachnospiraceae bacterium]